jgi:hypothetical protein
MKAKKEKQKRVTNHIVIEIDDEGKAYDIFEEIQNKYSFYDNCVIETEVSEDESIVDWDRQDETNFSLMWKRRKGK